MKLWQLKNPITNEDIGGLQPLPENWGPIFGMHNVKDRLGDLSWLGITDRCWVEVDITPPDLVKKDIDDRIAILFNEASEKLLDNSLTKKQWQQWVEYQKELQNIPLQTGYPNELRWPIKPE